MASGPVPADISLNKYSLEFQYSELQQATVDFDAKQSLGKGAFGAVYRGVRHDGTGIAVKVLDTPAAGGFEEEVRVLSKFRHPNLVILMGFARHGTQRCLVYELLEGGDVHKLLHRRKSEGAQFPWRRRVSVAFDAACGLSHLHNSAPKAFHRDIKSANILLDRNGTAKMADFGLSCLSNSQAQLVQKASGTPGYACPIYARSSIVTEGSEVYSFGVVLLELLTATRPAWITHSPSGCEQWNFLVSVIADAHSAVMLADSRAAWPQEVALALAELGFLCTALREDQRPSFAEVVTMLRRYRDMPDSQVNAGCSLVAPGAIAGRFPEGLASAAGHAFRTRARQANVKGPVLFTLDCVYVCDGDDAPCVIRSGSALVHRKDSAEGMLSPLKVGRLCQEAFFLATLPNEEFRNMVSREHFQVWMLDASLPNSPLHEDARAPCYFYITNLSSNFTSVNGVLLDAANKHAQLHDGDLIGIGRFIATDTGMHYRPFIQFRFQLSDSILRDAFTDDTARDAVNTSLPRSSLPRSSLRGDEAVTDELDALRSPAVQEEQELMLDCASFGGAVMPRFLLEVHGRGLRNDIPGKWTRIVHGPPMGSDANAWFYPLVLGRGHSTRFWQQVLNDDAFQALSREHLVLEHVYCAQASKVAVRNRSAVYPIRVAGSAEDHVMEQSIPMLVDELRELRQNDILVLSTGLSSFWLRFTDLSTGQAEAASDAPKVQEP